MNAHYLFPGVTLQAIAAECEREAGHRASYYPKRVDVARMTQADADFQLAACAAWREDIARMIDRRERSAAAWKRFRETGDFRTCLAIETRPAEHGMSWADRRAALQREIDLRRRFYPEWIATGRLEQSAADRQRTCLEALAAIYDDGWDWRASNGERPHFARIDAVGSEIEQARDEWANHMAAVDAARAPHSQQALAL